MLLRELEYVRPDTLDEAIEALNTLPDAGILAGGQSLVNVLKLRIGGYATLIDISRLSELKQIEQVEGYLKIGAGVTYHQLINSWEVVLSRPYMAQVAKRIADQQVRNRGTVGGNCCYNDPTCHLPPYLTALGATFEIQGKDGQREVAADDFFRGYYQTALEPGEMLISIGVPVALAGQGDGFSPLSVGGTDVLNVVTGAATAALNNEGCISNLRVVLTGASEKPLRLTTVEEALLGKKGSLSELDDAFALVDLGAFDPPDDVHASAEYRRAMAPVMARRALEEALRGARRGLYD